VSKYATLASVLDKTVLGGYRFFFVVIGFDQCEVWLIRVIEPAQHRGQFVSYRSPKYGLIALGSPSHRRLRLLRNAPQAPIHCSMGIVPEISSPASLIPLSPMACD
jgi:hypothetical protein